MAHNAHLSWNASADVVDGYNIYRGTSVGAEQGTPLNGSTLIAGLTFDDPTVDVGVIYSYVVTAVKNGFESLHSNEFTTPVVLPSAPTNLIVKIS